MPLSPHPGLLDLTTPLAPADLIDQYTELAAQWVASGMLHHTALVPAEDLVTINTLQDLGFGREQTYATRRTSHIPQDSRIRPARESDLDQILPLTPLIAATNVLSPVFAVLPSGFLEQLEDAHRREFTSEHSTYLVAELEEKIVGFTMISHMGSHPLWPDPTAELSVAVVAPEHRGKGLGVALALGAISWAFDADHAQISADWRTANFHAGRTWLKAGFQLTGYRMSRTIEQSDARWLSQ